MYSNRNRFMTHRVLNKYKAWIAIHIKQSNASILLITTHCVSKILKKAGSFVVLICLTIANYYT